MTNLPVKPTLPLPSWHVHSLTIGTEQLTVESKLMGIPQPTHQCRWLSPSHDLLHTSNGYLLSNLASDVSVVACLPFIGSKDQVLIGYQHIPSSGSFVLNLTRHQNIWCKRTCMHWPIQCDSTGHEQMLDPSKVSRILPRSQILGFKNYHETHRCFRFSKERSSLSVGNNQPN